jgi:hypothetical protein
MNRTVSIGTVDVDIESILSIAHQCIPGRCSRQACCCSQYEICLADSEVTRIVGYLPEASRYADVAEEGDAYENYFEEIEPGLFAIDMQDDGLCSFAYVNDDDHVLCSLHSAALELSLSPHRVKPESCVTWPLAISEDKPVTLSVADDALRFPCNRKRGKGRLSIIDPNIAAIIRDIYGVLFLKELEEAVRQQSG